MNQTSRFLPAAFGFAFACAGLAFADTVEVRWALTPGAANAPAYITTGNLERGVAINPATGNVLLVARTGSPTAYVLSPTDGSDGSAETGEPRALSKLDADGNPVIAGGTFTMNMVGVADDGAVYVCNLSSSTTFRIYRWANDAIDTPASIAFAWPAELPFPAGAGNDIRFGDNFAVRGAGLNTQLATTSRNGKYVLLFTTTDGLAFNCQVFTGDAAMSGKIGLATTFGAGDEIWAKAGSNPMTRIGLNPATSQATTLGTVALAGAAGGLGYDPVTKRLAAVDYSGHKLTLYDMANIAAPVQIGNVLAFPTTVANGNGTGAADAAGDFFVGLDTNNGLLFGRTVPTPPEPPAITVEPASVTAYAGARITLSVTAKGTTPLAYQWHNASGPIAGATGAALTLNAIAAADQGDYHVVINNVAGAATSSNATLTVKIPHNTAILNPLWALPPGSRDYIATDDSQRGLAFNQATGNLLLVSRTGANRVQVLDAATGAEKHTLSTTLEDGSAIAGGTYAVNLIGVTKDGVVYVGNLTTDGAASVFRLYRWENDSPETVPTMILGLDALAETVPDATTGYRWGDTMDVRGTSPNEQIVLGTRNHKRFAIVDNLAPGTGVAHAFDVPGDTIANGNFGLALVFGAGNTVWGTANGQTLLQMSFDLDAGTAALVTQYPETQIPLAVCGLGMDAEKGLLAALALELPDNVQLYDVSDTAIPPALVDQEMIYLDNANINGTAALDFGPDKLFVLDTNNGLLAYSISPAPPTLSGPKVAAANFEFTLTGRKGATYLIQTASPLGGGWTTVSEKTLSAAAETVQVPLGGKAQQFVRAQVK
jgi:hypothetical protein